MFCFFFKQKTAYEMRISDWSSDVCSSDLTPLHCGGAVSGQGRQCVEDQLSVREIDGFGQTSCTRRVERGCGRVFIEVGVIEVRILRSEEHTSELQSLMRISYVVFCLKKKIQIQQLTTTRYCRHDYL